MARGSVTRWVRHQLQWLPNHAAVCNCIWYSKSLLHCWDSGSRCSIYSCIREHPPTSSSNCTALSPGWYVHNVGSLSIADLLSSAASQAIILKCNCLSIHWFLLLYTESSLGCIVYLLKMCGWFKGLRVYTIYRACVPNLMTALSSHNDWNQTKVRCLKSKITPSYNTKIKITPSCITQRSKSQQATLHTPVCFALQPQSWGLILSKNCSKATSGLLPPPFLGNPRVAILRFTIYMTHS